MTLDRMTGRDANHGTHNLEMIWIIETLHGGHVGCDSGGVMDMTVGAQRT